MPNDKRERLHFVDGADDMVQAACLLDAVRAPLAT